MTAKHRNRNRVAIAADITGRAYHRLDGRWGRSRTIFDSELYKDLLAVIEDALSHASDPVRRQPVSISAMVAAAPLTDRQREVVTLRDQGLSLAEVAHEMGISRGTVQGYLLRVKAKIVGLQPASR